MILRFRYLDGSIGEFDSSILGWNQMITEAVIVRRPTLPQGLRIVRIEFMAMEYLGTPNDKLVCDGWQMVVIGDPHKITPELRAELKKLGWIHFAGRSAGTFRKKIAIRFEG